MSVEEIKQHFRLGIWAVKPEKREKFIEAWQTSSDWLTQKLPNERGAVLLEDTNDPTRFISYAPISEFEVTNEVMSGPEFQEHWGAVMQLCDGVEPHSMQVVSAARGQGVK
jgi:hypothetical protein